MLVTAVSPASVASIRLSLSHTHTCMYIYTYIHTYIHTHTDCVGDSGVTSERRKHTTSATRARPSAPPPHRRYSIYSLYSLYYSTKVTNTDAAPPFFSPIFFFCPLSKKKAFFLSSVLLNFALVAWPLYWSFVCPQCAAHFSAFLVLSAALLAICRGSRVAP